MNPLVELLDESVPVQGFFEALGFETVFAYYQDDEDVEYDDVEDYDPEHVIATWHPEIEGKTLMGVWDTEDGMVACFVEPTTPFARALLRFSQNWGVDECGSCDYPGAEKEWCPKSERPCGHHCNCSWTHDVCCWCNKEFENSKSDGV